MWFSIFWSDANFPKYPTVPLLLGHGVVFSYLSNMVNFVKNVIFYVFVSKYLKFCTFCYGGRQVYEHLLKLYIFLNWLQNRRQPESIRIVLFMQEQLLLKIMQFNHTTNLRISSKTFTNPLDSALILKKI